MSYRRPRSLIHQSGSVHLHGRHVAIAFRASAPEVLKRGAVHQQILAVDAVLAAAVGADAAAKAWRMTSLLQGYSGVAE